MKKSRNLIILLAVLLVILTAALLLLRETEDTPPEGPVWEESHPLDEVAPELIVYELDQPVAAIDVDSPSGGFTMRVTERETGSTYNIEGLEAATLDDMMASGTIIGASSMIADEVLEGNFSQAELAAFGLDSDAVTVTITDAGGGQASFLIGGVVPGGSNRYLLWEETVYLVPSYGLDGYLCDALDYVTPAITTATGAAQNYRRMTLSGTIRDVESVIEGTPGQDEDARWEYVITRPIARPLSQYNVQETIQPLFSLTAQAVELYAPDGEALSTYGLAEPYSIVKVEGLETGEDFTLLASAPDEEDTVYVQREGVPVIYRVDAASLPWLEADYYDFMVKYPVSLYPSQVSAFAIAAEGSSYHFQLRELSDTDDGDGEELTGSAEWTADYNGEALDPQVFYQIWACVLDAAIVEKPELQDVLEDTPPLLTVTYEYPGGGTDTVAFYDGPPRRLYVRLNDEPYVFLVSSSYWTELSQALDALQ